MIDMSIYGGSADTPAPEPAAVQNPDSSIAEPDLTTLPPPPDTNSQEDPAETGPSGQAIRRGRGPWAALGLLAAFGTVAALMGTGPKIGSAGTDEASAAADGPLTAVLDAAHGHHAATGTYAGFTYPEVRTAGNSDTFVAAVSVANPDGTATCVIGGIIAGADNVRTDPTGKGCTDAEFVLVEKYLATKDAVADVSAGGPGIPESAVARVAVTAQFYARTHGGSFVGVDAKTLGVLAVAVDADGRHMAVTLRGPKGCGTAVIGTDGSRSPIIPATC